MPELRKDPIIDRWVIISTERAKRPSDLIAGKTSARGGFCPLCPDNEDKTPREIFAIREGNSPPDTSGWRLRVVPNKFPALVSTGELGKRTEGMYDKMNGLGAHEVIVETPDHNATPATLQVENFKNILIAWRQRILAYGQDSRFRYVSIFKNHGIVAGSTLEHPHSQLIALPIVPKRTVEKLDGAQAYYSLRERCVFCDIISQEITDTRRIAAENNGFLAFEPFASRFPFETWIIPKAHAASFEKADEALIDGLAQILSSVLKKINAALDSPPYNLMLHSAPFHTDVDAFYHWHIEITPRLTRVAGFEWGTGFYINPTPPEQAAQYLREAWIG